MCGILISAGGTHSPEEQTFLELLDMLGPRGPDECWHVNTGGVMAGFTRLSLFGTSVPIANANPRNEAVHVLINGEIWNFSELKAELGSQVESEFELVREGYLAYGIQFVTRLDGMFFLAILDRAKAELFFARDPVGIKPAFFHHDAAARRLLLASDLKPLCKFPGVDVRINSNYLINQSAFSYTDYDDCIVTGIRQIPPGHYLHAAVLEDAVTECRVESFSSTILEQAFHTTDRLDMQLHLLEQAVLKRFQHSDTSTVGLLLSGGIDSSLIAFVARRLHIDRVVCFFVGTRDGQDFQWARWVAEQTQYQLHHIQPRAPEILRNLPQYCYEQSGEKGIVANLLASEIKQTYPEIKVVLCGEGSDELYAGYSWYVDARKTLNSMRQRLPRESMDTPMTRDFRSLVDGELNGADVTEPLLEFCLGPQLVNNHLLQLDHGFMSQGIELRVPFLDLNNVAFARSLPLEEKIRAGRTKSILKDFISKVFSVPEEFVERRKIGFPSALPPSILDLEFYAQAIIPTAWADAHPYKEFLRSRFDMMWLDLTCMVMLQGEVGSHGAITLSDLYSSQNNRKREAVLSQETTA